MEEVERKWRGSGRGGNGEKVEEMEGMDMKRTGYKRRGRDRGNLEEIEKK